MNVRNCTRCKRIFNYVTGQSICAQCKTELEKLFKDVRLYIRRNPEASINKVAEECSVDGRQIRQWIREERLSFSESSGVGIECELCGKTIRTGRFCEQCKSETLGQLQSVSEPKNSKSIEKAPEPKKNKMRYMNKDR